MFKKVKNRVSRVRHPGEKGKGQVLRCPAELAPVKGSARVPRLPHPSRRLQSWWRGSTECQELPSCEWQAALAGDVLRSERGGQERSSVALCGIVF